MFSATLINTNDTLIKYNIEIDSASFSLVQSKMLQGPTLGAKNVTQYMVMLCLRYTELTRHLAGPG